MKRKTRKAIDEAVEYASGMLFFWFVGILAATVLYAWSTFIFKNIGAL